MAYVRLADSAYVDLLRLEEFLWQQQDPLSHDLLDFILDALNVLTHQPAIGRPAEQGLRELIIKRGSTGYLAKYRIHHNQQLVEVLRIRHQRESGYTAEV